MLFYGRESRYPSDSLVTRLSFSNPFLAFYRPRTAKSPLGSHARSVESRIHEQSEIQAGQEWFSALHAQGDLRAARGGARNQRRVTQQCRPSPGARMAYYQRGSEEAA